MALSYLAQKIYSLLRTRVPGSPAKKCLIRYHELVDAVKPLPANLADLHFRDLRLDEALGELVHACRARSLPAISAMVVNEEGYPGPGYYPIAHPGIRDSIPQIVKWSRELEKVAKQTYPTLNAEGELP